MVKILLTGDFCPINRIEQLAKEENYESIFNNFFSVLKGNDLNITNLECPLYSGRGAIQKAGPNLHAFENSSKILKFGNFHLITLANNHSMDFGSEGLRSTLEICRKEGISTVGAGFNLQDARRPFYETIKGIRIAILNVAENEFSTTHGKEPGANPLNPISNYYDIKSARINADFLLVIVHGGHEHYQLPSPRMQETYRFFIDAGADAIVGHHTHCYCGYEIYQGKPIFYSLGNFIMDWPGKRNSAWNNGFAVLFTINGDYNISFMLYPLVQGDEKPGVRLMNDSERKVFEDQLTLLNIQINDPEKMKTSFQRFLQPLKRSYMTLLQPYTNRYLSSLYSRGLIPSFFSKKKKKILLNSIRCEAHRDLLIETLID